jgi:tetraacyldisaccharide 4'-kinase
LPLPSVSVGNLSVGGTGKTPLASWIAGRYAQRGITPGILLRGYGQDEGDVHREAVGNAVVVEDPDRLRGARKAMAAGARILVLDDAFQRLDVRRDLDMVLVAVESLTDKRRLIPAGPWREPWTALARANHVVVTRKRASLDDAVRVAERLERVVHSRCPIAIAELHLSSFRGLFSNFGHPTSLLRGARITAIAGVADPASFGSQLEALEARVELQEWPDHHAFTTGDVERIRRAARGADFVVMTAKDAAKLRNLWPVDGPEPMVANISVRWERGGHQVERALCDLTIHCGGSR